jgi:hypothetical protein
LARLLDTKWSNTVRHQNSVLHALLKHVPWDAFDRLVSTHGADEHVRCLSTKSQFIALLYGQFSGASSLREIVGGLESHAARLYHVGGRTVSRSTLADANAVRPSAMFGDLFAVMVAQAQCGLRRTIGEATSLIAFARLVRANLMHRRRIDRLIGDDPKPRIDSKQMVLKWT